ncbi:prepilin-type N-terminal cleavage/methylation domain-containing protein [Cognatilysobacter bugurensis]|uniref:Prepilin-type N-terminal cleavage/methylation domain-containing protein n=1 Tax=Cognatilysobacter bugurensis TaxID=543356 RepID=A0A918SZ95_9GAMM|nr:prepilin-type N-terminal cleavage/methylation domain-containing protein [Lysobacter bugurensis]GHA77762.1 prepilin-type N-terminal cleavage/methylation domain-containing protein [Lysobacter bugurensis]
MRRQPSFRRSQGGFTLVEIAVVLVIVGLLLGAVLKGQELIENSRVRSAVNDITGIRASTYGYLDRYRATPGDDARIAGRGDTWTGQTAGNGNNMIGAANADPFQPVGENLQFFQHLRAAGFLTGDAAAATLPMNGFGGLVGVSTLTTALGNMNSRAICVSQAPGKAAIAMDNQMDDGVPNTGSVRATEGSAGMDTAPGAVATAYNEAGVYTLCTQL